MKIERIAGTNDVRLTMTEFEASVYARALMKVSEIYLDEYMKAPLSDAYEVLNRDFCYCKNAGFFIGDFVNSGEDERTERGFSLDDDL